MRAMMDAAPPVHASSAQPMGISRSGLDVNELDLLARTLEAKLRALAGGSILITGATGWFGVWLLDLLCFADDAFKLGIRIAAVSRAPQRFLARFGRFSDPRIAWLETDVRHLEPAAGFSHVIHGAADNSITSDANAPLQLFETIVEGTRRALAAAGPNCKGFLLLSSGAVYGPARRNRAFFAEDDYALAEEQNGLPGAAGPDHSYAAGKRAAEQLCVTAGSSGVPARIARCFAFVGPHMPFDKHFAIGNFIADATAGRQIRVKSDGKPVRSYMYMTDLMRALIVILIDGAVARPYNVGSDAAVSIEQLAHRVDHIAGGSGVLIEGAPSDPADRYVPDIGRLNRELQCPPEVALDAAVARTAGWYRANSSRSVP
jgi:nucleoside-diphosphate-sugar epimerase